MEYLKEIYCSICGHLLFKIDTNIYTKTEVYGNKAYFKYYGSAKPLLKHVDVFTKCDKCGDIDTHSF